MEHKTLYVEVNGKLVPFDKLPCSKCEWRYSLHCPHGCWNADGKVNTYDLREKGGDEK